MISQLPLLKNSPTSASHRRWKTVVITLGLIAFAVQWVRVGSKEVGDFKLHWEFGRRLVAGEYLYGEFGTDLPYLPFWALAHAPLTILPTRAAQVVLVPLFLLAFWGLTRTLGQLSNRHWPIDKDRAFWLMALATLMASRFLIRDVLECGVNLLLVTLAWLSFYLWTKKRDVLGGSCLGLAVALKMTPALFIVWFAWKRQWKIVASSLTVTAALMLSPMLIMGWDSFSLVHQVWFQNASRGLANTDPSQGVLGEEPLQNMALRPALGRYLMTLPPGHDARIDHPAYVDFLSLPPGQAAWVIKLTLLALAGGVFWQFRRSASDRNDPRLLWEAAAISVMILLYSPLTWGQHCVGVLPILYLLLRGQLANRSLPKVSGILVAAYVFTVLVLNRTVIGKTGTYLLDSYHLPTYCLLGLLVTALIGHARVSCPAESQETITETPPDFDGQLTVRSEPVVHERVRTQSATAL